VIDKAEWEEEGEEKEAGGGKEECKDRRVGGWPSMTRLSIIVLLLLENSPIKLILQLI
jgi:hypothetical protein